MAERKERTKERKRQRGYFHSSVAFGSAGEIEGASQTRNEATFLRVLKEGSGPRREVMPTTKKIDAPPSRPPARRARIFTACGQAYCAEEAVTGARARSLVCACCSSSRVNFQLLRGRRNRRTRTDEGDFTLSPRGLCAVGCAITILISVGGGKGKEEDDGEDGTFSAVRSRDSVSVTQSCGGREG